MRTRTKIGVIGGGSTFTPELIDRLVGKSDILGSVQVVMMDVDQHRLDIVTGLSQRIAAKSGAPVEIVTVGTVEEAITGADFVLLQFRQGGIDERIADEKLGLKHKLPFTETVSVCGFSTFLRTYYEAERIAAAIRQHAPNAWVLNFTNPAGQVTEALARLGITRVIGVCQGSVAMLDTLAGITGRPADELFMNWRGLNHLTIVDGVYHDGEDVMPEVLERITDANRGGITVPAALVRALGFIPHQYFQYYYTRRALTEKLQQAERVRSEVVKEVNAELFALYEKVDHLPAELQQRGGYRYSEVVVEVMCGIAGDLGTTHYVVVENNGTIADLPDDAWVEVPTVAHAEGLIPLQTGALPVTVRSLILGVKDYDQLAIQGAMARDRDLLLRSLIAHPLIGDWGVAEPLLQDVLALNDAYIPALD